MAYQKVSRCGIVLYIPNFFCLFDIYTMSFAHDPILDSIDLLPLQSICKALEDVRGLNFLSLWDFTSNLCNFTGIYCGSDKGIALNLRDPRADAPSLINKLNPTISKLSDLAKLIVVPSIIYSSLPQSLSNLKNLRFLGVMLELNFQTSFSQ